MQISTIYGPIQEEMVSVEQRLLSLRQDAPEQMSEFLVYALKDPGKLLRPALTLLSGKSFSYNKDLMVTMAAAVELLHTATLIHDDTVDHAQVRRGRPTISSMLGQGTAVLVGDYLFAASAEMAASTDDTKISRLFAQTVMAVSAAELEASYSTFDSTQTRERYYKRISFKTASLFVLATSSGAVLARAPKTAADGLKDYGQNLGLAFQIIDDVLDFVGEAETMGKPVGHDLLQGTLTLPAILSLERHPQDNPIQRLFAKQGNPDDLRLALDMIVNSNVIGECYDIARDFCSKATQSLKDVPQGPCRQALEELTEYVVQRKK